MLNLVLDICRSEFSFNSFENVNPYFKDVINKLKQMNYSEFRSDDFTRFENELKELLKKQEAVHAN